MVSMPTDPLLPFLQRHGVMLLDGGLATELESRGRKIDDDLWSAGVLLDDPDLIRAVHFDYLRAGADCITGASYQATFAGLERRGLGESAAADCLRLSVELARQARDTFWSQEAARAERQRPLIAASIGPYGAYLADGSEYRGDYGLDIGALVTFHERRFGILATSGADLLACESIPAREEAEALLRLLCATDTMRAWFSFTCRDGAHLSDGTPIAVVAAELDREDRVAAIGVNCTAPRFIAPLLGALRESTSKPLVVYPNSGESYDPTDKRWSGPRSPVDFATAAPGWVEAGARLVGGCCRTGPDHIRRMRSALIEGA
jgi:homocysteine S-methyltransferase